MPENGRILITGATGAVGSELVKLLAPQEAHRVRLATRKITGDVADQYGAEAVRFDYDDPVTYDAALDGVERVFLVTGYSVHMLGHSKLFLDAARRNGVTHVVHLGATSEAEQPFEHLMWHAYVESYIEKLGFGFTHLQPRTFMLNVLNQIRPLSGEIKHFLGHTVAPWVDTADVAAVACAALRDPSAHCGKTYRLCGEAADMETVCAALSEAVGMEFSAVAMDTSVLPELYLKGGMEPVYAQSLAKIIKLAAAGRIEGYGRTFDDIERVLGRPAATWADFARRAAPSIRDRMAQASRGNTR